MAMTTTVDEKNNLITFKNTGHRTTEVVAESETVVSKQFDKNGKVLLLIDWTEFQGQIDEVKGLIWIVAKLSLMVERTAIVASENLTREVERWQHQVEEIPIRHFPPEGLSDARTWLITSDEKAAVN